MECTTPRTPSTFPSCRLGLAALSGSWESRSGGQAMLPAQQGFPRIQKKKKKEKEKKQG